jgi:hypothetical protein
MRVAMRHRSLHQSTLLGLLALLGSVAGCLVKDSAVPEVKTDGPTAASDAARTDGSGDGGSAGAIGTEMGGSDGPAGSGPVDAPPPASDGAGTCAKDQECAPLPYCVAGKCGTCTVDFCKTISATPFCGPAGLCVPCLASSDCDPNSSTPLCVNNACAGCSLPQPDAGAPSDGGAARDGGASARSCSAIAGKNVCEPSSGRCVQCVEHSDCPVTTPICSANMCVPCTPGPSCMMRDPSKPVCDTASGSCVECLGSDNCTGDPKKPICHPDEHKCYPCVADGECAAKPGFEAPAICMFHQDGRCATEGESIYVQNLPSCTGGGGGQGTAASPFCLSQDAIGKVSPSRRVIVMKGSNSNFTAQLPDGEVTIIGKDGATINPGVFIGINLLKGSLYVRGLTVESGANVGVVAAAGTTLKMDRCLIHNNKGGLVIDGAGYQIVNTIIAANQAGGYPSVLGAIGGVYLKSASKGLTEFRYNTIVNNKNYGLECAGPYVTSGLIVYNNELSPPVTMCTTANSVTTDCKLDPANFHLTASSTDCIDQGGEAPRDDFDGDTRPQGGKSDIGADEYR